jgi:putative colanic acid biosynthesis UDP-glucose lipid carrier transferase
MQSELSQILRSLFFRVFDPVVLVLVLLIFTFNRFSAPIDATPDDLLKLDQIRKDHFALLLVMFPASMIALHLSGTYSAMRGMNLNRWCGRAMVAMCLILGLFLVVVYGLQISQSFSRQVVLGWFAVSTALLMASRAVLFRTLTEMFRRGYGMERVVLAGSSNHSLRFARHLGAHPDLGMKVVATALSESGTGAEGRNTEQYTRRRPDSAAPAEEPGVGDDALDMRASRAVAALRTDEHAGIQLMLSDLPEFLSKNQVDRVVICGKLGDRKLLMEVMNQLLTFPIPVQYALDYSAVAIFSLRMIDCGGQPLMDLSASPLSESSKLLKWIEDMVLATIILICASPIMVAVAIAVRLSSPGPILFIQERHGLGGKPVRIYKFRTMYTPKPPPPEALKPREKGGSADSGGEYVAADAPAQHMDPRVTKIGNFLRKTSLDEFPQFINVLKGDMSIVGPRPHPINLNNKFVKNISDLMRRHYVKPGITGLAQISGARGDASTVRRMRKRVNYDLEYIRHWSLWLDLKIIALSALKGLYNKEP